MCDYFFSELKVITSVHSIKISKHSQTHKNKHKQEPCLECPRNRGEASTFVAEGGRRAKRDEDRFRAGPHAAPGRGKDSDFYFD